MSERLCNESITFTWLYHILKVLVLEGLDSGYSLSRVVRQQLEQQIHPCLVQHLIHILSQVLLRVLRPLHIGKASES